MAIDAFLHVPFTEGEATCKGFEGDIEILSFARGASNPSTIGPGSTGAGGGRATLSNFICTKATNKASPLLFQHCASGKHFDKVTVTLNKAGGDEPVKYLTYIFENCFLEAVSCSGSTLGGDDRPTEDLSFAFGKVTAMYHPQASDSGSQGPKAMIGSWDITTGTP